MTFEDVFATRFFTADVFFAVALVLLAAVFFALVFCAEDLFPRPFFEPDLPLLERLPVGIALDSPLQ